MFSMPVASTHPLSPHAYTLFLSLEQAGLTARICGDGGKISWRKKRRLGNGRRRRGRINNAKALHRVATHQLGIGIARCKRIIDCLIDIINDVAAATEKPSTMPPGLCRHRDEAGVACRWYVGSF